MEEISKNVGTVFGIAFGFEIKMEERFKELNTRIDAIINKESDAEGPLTPVQNKKRAVQLSPVKDGNEDEAENESDSTRKSEAPSLLRPVRTARVKAATSLKEPTLNKKMRRPASIKKERVSDEAGKENKTPNESAVSASEPSELESPQLEVPKQSLGPKKKAERESKRKPTNDSSVIDVSKVSSSGDGAKKVKLSVEIIPTEEVKVEVLSDDERMPPPPAPAPKGKRAGRPRTKKQTKQPDDSARSSQLDDEEPTEPPKATRSTRTKSKNVTTGSATSETEVEPPKKPVVKVERLTAEEVKRLTSTPKANRTKSGNSEASSVYEDAVGDARQMQETFVKPTAPSIAAATPPTADQTYSLPTPSPNGTFDCNGTYTVPVMNSAGSVKVPTPASMQDSIMTEDRSDEEELPPAPPAPKFQPLISLKSIASEPMYKHGKPMMKKPELFNPNIQSPIKAKIQAFEKAAAARGTPNTFLSPAHTRMKTRIGTASLQKNATTPKVATASVANFRTPIQLQTASSAPSLLFAKASSTSKLAHIQKKTGAVAKQAREKSVDRIDEIKKAAALFEEKKRKREEKTRLAQMQREQLEKERKLRLEQKKAEDDERMRKFKQQQDQIRAQKALEQQKREEQVRMELQKRAYENQQLEAMKSKHNESLQRKAIHMNMLKSRTEHHDFTILQTDDSTDDEGKMNKKRPVPPSWSRGSNRRAALYLQSRTPLTVIDALFSVQPLTVNLKEIFPSIDSQKLKRNSSAVWSTPPRYSEVQRQIQRPF